MQNVSLFPSPLTSGLRDHSDIECASYVLSRAASLLHDGLSTPKVSVAADHDHEPDIERMYCQRQHTIFGQQSPERAR